MRDEEFGGETVTHFLEKFKRGERRTRVIRRRLVDGKLEKLERARRFIESVLRNVNTGDSRLQTVMLSGSYCFGGEVLSC